MAARAVIMPIGQLAEKSRLSYCWCNCKRTLWIVRATFAATLE